MSPLEWEATVKERVATSLHCPVVIDLSATEVEDYVLVQGEISPPGIDRAVPFTFFGLPLAGEYVFDLGEGRGYASMPCVEQGDYEGGKMGWAALVALRSITEKL